VRAVLTMALEDTREGQDIARTFDTARWQESIDRLRAAMAAAENDDTVTDITKEG
jgi:hypothetical protein